MNKKLREILENIESKKMDVKSELEKEDKDITVAEKLMEEIEVLKKEYAIEEKLFNEEIKEATEDVKEVKELAKEITGFEVVRKLLSREVLNEQEKAMLAIGGSNGESLLIPQDIRTEINELRKSYVSAKDLVTVIPTIALTGSFNYETADALPGLADMTDGTALDNSKAPKFKKTTFTIKFKGRIIPVSNILVGAEKASLMSYLNSWFIKNAIITENKDIFTALKKSSATEVAGWNALKTVVNKLDPNAKVDGVVVTSASGFACLDAETDATGRGILEVNPTNPTQKMFQGLPVIVFPDSDLADLTSGTKFPMFVGSLKAGATFVEHKNLEFATSTEFLFGTNQTALRVVEGYDVIKGDEGAYEYISFEASKKK